MKITSRNVKFPTDCPMTVASGFPHERNSQISISGGRKCANLIHNRVVGDHPPAGVLVPGLPWPSPLFPAVGVGLVPELLPPGRGVLVAVGCLDG